MGMVAGEFAGRFGRAGTRVLMESVESRESRRFGQRWLARSSACPVVFFLQNTPSIVRIVDAILGARGKTGRAELRLELGTGDAAVLDWDRQDSARPASFCRFSLLSRSRFQHIRADHESREIQTRLRPRPRSRALKDRGPTSPDTSLHPLQKNQVLFLAGAGAGWLEPRAREKLRPVSPARRYSTRVDDASRRWQKESQDISKDKEKPFSISESTFPNTLVKKGLRRTRSRSPSRPRRARARGTERCSSRQRTRSSSPRANDSISSERTSPQRKPSLLIRDTFGERERERPPSSRERHSLSLSLSLSLVLRTDLGARSLSLSRFEDTREGAQAASDDDAALASAGAVGCASHDSASRTGESRRREARGERSRRLPRDFPHSLEFWFFEQKTYGG